MNKILYIIIGILVTLLILIIVFKEKALIIFGNIFYNKRPMTSNSNNNIMNFFGGNTFLSKAYPRGIRNNNPGNLRITAIKWQGKVPNEENTDKSFEQFYRFEYGLRAMLKDIINDHKKGKNTVNKLISEYAPASENNTQAYISNVAKSLNIGINDIFILNEKALKLISFAISDVENGGKEWFTDKHFNNAYKLI